MWKYIPLIVDSLTLSKLHELLVTTDLSENLNRFQREFVSYNANKSSQDKWAIRNSEFLALNTPEFVRLS